MPPPVRALQMLHTAPPPGRSAHHQSNAGFPLEIHPRAFSSVKPPPCTAALRRLTPFCPRSESFPHLDSCSAPTSRHQPRSCRGLGPPRRSHITRGAWLPPAELRPCGWDARLRSCCGALATSARAEALPAASSSYPSPQRGKGGGRRGLPGRQQLPVCSARGARPAASPPGSGAAF